MKSIGRLVLIGMLSQGMTCMSTLPPGQVRDGSPSSVWSRLDCQEKPLPHLLVERSVVTPKGVAPGSELRHILIYSMCPDAPGRAVAGRLHRRIVQGDSVIRDHVAEGFEIKPGRWIVTAMIRVPPGAQLGDYRLVTQFEGEQLTFVREAVFAVRNK